MSFCFHGDDKHTLPLWVLQEGQESPDIFFTDRAGVRNTECLSIGVDHGKPVHPRTCDARMRPALQSLQAGMWFRFSSHMHAGCCSCSAAQAEAQRASFALASVPLSVPAVPVLGGRTALQAYADLMVSFREQFRGLLGAVVTDANIGLGPKGELRYPSNPLDDRWNFPGIGEFQVGWGRMRVMASGAKRQPRVGTSVGVLCMYAASSSLRGLLTRIALPRRLSIPCTTVLRPVYGVVPVSSSAAGGPAALGHQRAS